MQQRLRWVSRVTSFIFFGLTGVSICLWFWVRPLSYELSSASVLFLLISLLCDSYLPQAHLSAANNLKLRKSVFAGLGFYLLSLLFQLAQWQSA